MINFSIHFSSANSAKTLEKTLLLNILKFILMRLPCRFAVWFEGGLKFLYIGKLNFCDERKKDIDFMHG